MAQSQPTKSMSSTENPAIDDVREDKRKSDETQENAKDDDLEELTKSMDIIDLCPNWATLAPVIDFDKKQTKLKSAKLKLAGEQQQEEQPTSLPSFSKRSRPPISASRQRLAPPVGQRKQEQWKQQQQKLLPPTSRLPPPSGIAKHPILFAERKLEMQNELDPDPNPIYDTLASDCNLEEKLPQSDEKQGNVKDDGLEKVMRQLDEIMELCSNWDSLAPTFDLKKKLLELKSAQLMCTGKQQKQQGQRLQKPLPPLPPLPRRCLPVSPSGQKNPVEKEAHEKLNREEEQDTMEQPQPQSVRSAKRNHKIRKGLM